MVLIINWKAEKIQIFRSILMFEKFRMNEPDFRIKSLKCYVF